MKDLQSSVSATLIFVCVCVIGVHNLQYSDIEMLGVQTCPMKDSCRLIGNATFLERNCECDRQCAHYDDCCVDATTPPARLKTRLRCVDYAESYVGVYVIGRCPANYAGSIDIINQCQNNNFSDPILSAPVTDTSTGKTYLNSYCAICNDAPLHLKTWLISVDCEVPRTTDRNFTLSDLIYRFRRWNIQHRHRTYPCQFRFGKPTDISTGLRFCRTNLISSCPSTWRRESYITACKSYTSMVRTENGLVYRNPHCALCNGHKVDNISCFNSLLHGRKKRPFSFALLLDVNRSDGDLVGISRPGGQSCPDDQRYDPFFKKCRAVVCGIPGYQLVNGKCVKT